MTRAYTDSFLLQVATEASAATVLASVRLYPRLNGHQWLVLTPSTYFLLGFGNPYP